jgi:hypothetical protein
MSLLLTEGGRGVTDPIKTTAKNRGPFLHFLMLSSYSTNYYFLSIHHELLRIL